MKNLNEISDELKALSATVASIPNRNPYFLPENYFANFPSVVLDKIATGIPFCAKSPLELPADYFQNFPGMMMQRIRSEEALEINDELPPLLASVSKEMPYHLPENYFANNHFHIPAAEPRKPVLMKPVHSFRRYAVAASVTALIALGGWLFLSPPAASSDSAINYQEARNLNIDAELSTVDATTLDAYLAETPKNFAVAFLQADEQINTEDNVSSVNTDELDEFLTEQAL